MRILFYSDNYPSQDKPVIGIFVFNFVQELVSLGHDVVVVSPRSVTGAHPWHCVNLSNDSATNVYRPRFLSFSARVTPFGNTYWLSRKQKVLLLKEVVRRNNLVFDVVYCHFIQGALIASEAFFDSGTPIFVTVGENMNIQVVRNRYDKREYDRFISRIRTFFPVSFLIRDILVNQLNIPSSKVVVAANGVDLEFFQNRGRHEMRLKHNLPAHDFIVIFVGRFIESKGPLRVIEALKNETDVGCLFLGSGVQRPSGSNVLMARPVERQFIPELLSAADVFVLPTLFEGASNAIVEAMAVGLPMVTSDIPEVREQVTEKFAILVNPTDIQAIREAVLKLRNDVSLRQKMSEQAILYSKNFSTRCRVERIVRHVMNKTTNEANNESAPSCQ